MVVPAFVDISKAASDILNRDFFHSSPGSLEVRSKTNNGVQFLVKGKSDAKSGVIQGSLEAKCQDRARGVCLSQTWSTQNSLDTKLELENPLVDGLKLDLSGQLSTSSSKSGKVNLQIRKPLFTARILLDALNGPHCSGDIVLSKNGAMLGGEAKYDVSSGRITKYSYGVGYSGKDYTASVVGINAMQTFVVSYYHKVHQSAEIASKFTIDAKNATPSTLEVGTKYRLDSDTFVKAKLNSKGVAAFGYSQAVRKGVCLGLGLSLDTLKLQEPSHQIGISLTFEA